MDVVEMVLAGSINKKIVAAINAEGGKAVGISGKDASLMTVRKLEKQIPDPDSNLMKVVDLGFVGEPDKVDPHIIEVMIASDLIPVIAPLGVSREGQTYNINADTFAGVLAAKMCAKRLLLLTDVEGVLDKQGRLISQLTIESARALIDDGTIDGGMIPKIESCISVVQSGVEAVVIINGKTPHAVLLELFTEHGTGTLLSSTRED
jgi:acetylglutamate kinase